MCTHIHAVVGYLETALEGLRLLVGSHRATSEKGRVIQFIGKRKLIYRMFLPITVIWAFRL